MMMMDVGRSSRKRHPTHASANVASWVARSNPEVRDCKKVHEVAMEKDIWSVRPPERMEGVEDVSTRGADVHAAQMPALERMGSIKGVWEDMTHVEKNQILKLIRQPLVEGGEWCWGDVVHSDWTMGEVLFAMAAQRAGVSKEELGEGLGAWTKAKVEEEEKEEGSGSSARTTTPLS
jgi:hypothetical protein